MADEADAESKTEDPTPRRRDEARRQGRVPFSAELVGSMVLLAGVLGINSMGLDIWTTMSDVFRGNLTAPATGDFGPSEAQEVLLRVVARALGALGPFLGLLMAVGIAASVVQVGFQINNEKLEINFERLNPVEGFGKLFSMSSLVRGGLMILKVIALGVVAYIVLERRAGIIMGVGRDRLSGAVSSGWAVVMRLAIYLVSAVALVALIDYIYQRRKFEQSLRMTKQELKDELKQEEGDPQIKGRIRQIQRERIKRQMLAEVPKATVVLTNPTHYAVALRYESGRDSAPVVVARGTGYFAIRIARLARDHSVPVLERPALARAIYAAVREGQPIPGTLFRAVAEVLAFVYGLRGIRPGTPTT